MLSYSQPYICTPPAIEPEVGARFKRSGEASAQGWATARSALADGVVGLAPAVIPYLVWDALPRRPWQAGGAGIGPQGIALFLILLHLFFISPL